MKTHFFCGATSWRPLSILFQALAHSDSHKTALALYRHMRYNISKGVEEMEKNATLNIRINPDVKKSAETVLSKLGVPMATAVDMFLKQVTLTGGIPFAVTLPKAPESVNADMMSVSQIREKLAGGLSDIESGKVRSARETFKRFKESHADETL